MWAHTKQGVVLVMKQAPWDEAGRSCQPDLRCVFPCRTVTVWEWTGAAADEGDEAAAWFSKYLDVPVRLVR